MRNVLLAATSLALVMAQGTAQAAYKVANPYQSSQNSFDKLNIRRLVVFGDSYSQPDWWPGNNWTEQMVGSGVQFQSNYAVPGATAVNAPTNNQPTNSLRQQVDRFLGAGISYSPRDITVVYIGYNDINRLTGLANSQNEYTKNVDRLRTKGATNQNRRMLLVMEHNMLHDPVHTTRVAKNLPAWNQHVATVANARSNVIAVDLYTAFERIYADPARYGFANVTTPNAARSSIDALYYDERHLGERGHKLIQQVFRHYLSRGWDWANTLKAGSQTVAQLNQDLSNGLVFDTYALVGEDDGALQLVPLGMAGMAEAPSAYALDAGPAMGFAPQDAGPADAGLAMSWRLGEQTRMSFVLGSYGGSADGETAVGSAETEASSRASGVVLDHRLGRLGLRSSILYSDDRYETSSYDSFVGGSVSAGFGGSTLRVGQRVGWAFENESLSLTPWAELSYQRQEADSFTIADPYVSDLTYDSSPVSETSAAVGLSLDLAPIELGEKGLLRLAAGVGYTHGLAADDYKVRIREAAVNGYTQRETIANEPDRAVDLSLGASWEATPGMALTAGYRLDAPVGSQADRDTEHLLTAGISWRF